jgi:hypothetical protein
LTTDEAIRNSGSLTFKKLKKEYLSIVNLESIQTHSASHFRDFLSAVTHTKAKTRLIVVTNDSVNAKQAIESIAPFTGEITAKLIAKATCKNYQILDNKEIWISVQQKTESGHPCVLCTNDQNIIDVYMESFRKVWSRAKTIRWHTVYSLFTSPFSYKFPNQPISEFASLTLARVSK